MQPKKIPGKQGPEAKIQAELVSFLRAREWLVKSTHGNLYQSGFPDLYCAHHKFGQRWVEVKNPEAYRFTNAQILEFPRFAAAGVGIWILVEATESEYQKLFKPCNWYQFIKGVGCR